VTNKVKFWTAVLLVMIVGIVYLSLRPKTYSGQTIELIASSGDSLLPQGSPLYHVKASGVGSFWLTSESGEIKGHVITGNNFMAEGDIEASVWRVRQGSKTDYEISATSQISITHYPSFLTWVKTILTAAAIYLFLFIGSLVLVNHDRSN